MKKLIAIVALASGMGAAYADQPVALNDAQMDNVTAGLLIASGAQAAGAATAFFGITNVAATASTVATPVATAASATAVSTALGILPASISGAQATSIVVR